MAVVENKLNLADLKPGTTATISSVDTSLREAPRLMELGLIPGERVTMIRSAPLGDPMQIEVMGYSLCLRKKLARSIEVTHETHENHDNE